jgi:cell division protein FtsW (lipid II flippase)
MSFEEKGAWIMAVVAPTAYLAYLAVILGRADGAPLAEVSYVSTMLWTIGAAIAASIVLVILVAIASPKEADKKDQRDREINRFGEYIGQSFVVIGGVAALIMSMAELAHFWIANVIYLTFVLSAILGSVTKIVAYRRGFQQW